jgi:phenylalanine-4-hydroxylase
LITPETTPPSIPTNPATAPTKYAIDDFQQTYFVIESFEELLAACYQDFAPLYERLAGATDIEPLELIEGDEVLTRGTLAYFTKDRIASMAPAS